MANQFDTYQKLLNHERFQSGLMVGQTVLMDHMATSLNQLQGEMAAIRDLNLQGLAIQQEMLQREQLQSQLEEFIYVTQKLIKEYSDDACSLNPSCRYFSLKGISETVQQLGIGTSLIRGRDNKAAFEGVMTDVRRLAKALESDPEVIDAIEWAKAEQKRLVEERRKKKANQERIAAKKVEKQAELVNRIAELRMNRRKLKFSEWYGQKFDSYLNRKHPFDSLPGLSSLPADLYRIIAPIILWGPLPFGLCYGCVWIPIMFHFNASKAEVDLNFAVDAEIARLEQELAAL